MMRHWLFGLLIAIASFNANAGLIDGPQIATMADFKDGKFQFQSVKRIYWHELLQGRSTVERAETI